MNDRDALDERRNGREAVEHGAVVAALHNGLDRFRVFARVENTNR